MVIYDNDLKAEYLKGDFKSRFHNMEELSIKDFTSVDVLSANVIDATIEKGPKFAVWVKKNFKDEIKKYLSYKNVVTDEQAYLIYIIKLINPVHDYALYSYCVELELSDALLEQREEKLLENIAGILGIEQNFQYYTKKMMMQRKAVESCKIF